jgi:hypothetical protein
MTQAPETLWLQLGYGDEGSHTWSKHKTGEVEEEVEYIRMDSHRTALTELGKLKERVAVLEDFIELCAGRFWPNSASSDDVVDEITQKARRLMGLDRHG